MGIRAAVADLADVIADHRSPLSEHESRVYEALRRLPEEPDVGWWDDRYKHVASQPSPDSDAPGSALWLMDRVWWFGGSELYGAFDPARSQRSYVQVINDLNQHLGLELAPTEDVSRY